jgi:hypothetical protein
MGAFFSRKCLPATEAEKHIAILALLTTGRASDAPQAVVTYGLNAPALMRLVTAVILGKGEEMNTAVDAYLESHRHVVGAAGIGMAMQLKSWSS